MLPATPGGLPNSPRLGESGQLDPDAAEQLHRAGDGTNARRCRRCRVYTQSDSESDEGKVYGVCTQLWWPKRGQAPGPGVLRPRAAALAAYGKRDPNHVFARAYGFLDRARPATRYLMLHGYAGPSASRVRVAFEERGGRLVEVPVKLTPVDSALGERMGADAPFGFFVAFVLHTRRAQPNHVSSYDASGERLSTDTRRLGP